MQTLVWNTLSETQKNAACARPASASSADAAAAVRTIMDAVKQEGDKAVRRFAEKFDGCTIAEIFLSENEIADAVLALPPKLKSAIDAAYANIRLFHEMQGYKPYTTQTTPGLECSRLVVPVQSVGLYIPSGTAPLFSTVLMLGIPSQIAGNPTRVLCTPANREGAINPAIIYAATLCGIRRIARIGGAQAIAAMAYGTQTMPRMAKIFGPGNIYVTLAKTMAAQEAGGPAIDMPAGPSEVLVIADETTPANFAAADLLAQAEHDTNAQVVLVCTSAGKAAEIDAEVKNQLARLNRAAIAAKALENSITIIAGTLDEAIGISNTYAPEHLILLVQNAQDVVANVTNAGSVFVGLQTPESLGDYASGTNHVLPTAAAARAYSGLNVEAFQKTITCQKADTKALEAIGPAVITMAMNETLDAHANAVAVRLVAEYAAFAKNTLAPAALESLNNAFKAYKTGDTLDMEIKTDGTPASRADRDTEATLRGLISAAYPGHGIAGEEYGTKNPEADFVWVLDPLDGTKEFLATENGWGSLVALLYQGMPVLGLIIDPQKNIIWSQDLPKKTMPAKATGQTPSAACTSPEGMFNGTEFEAGAKRFFAAVATQTRLNCLGFAYVADGSMDIAVECGLKLHDIAALLPPLWAAGATCKNLEGQDYKTIRFNMADAATAKYALVTSLDAALVETAIQTITGTKP